MRDLGEGVVVFAVGGGDSVVGAEEFAQGWADGVGLAPWDFVDRLVGCLRGGKGFVAEVDGADRFWRRRVELVVDELAVGASRVGAVVEEREEAVEGEEGGGGLEAGAGAVAAPGELLGKRADAGAAG